jgi:3-keto-5-aminohexanoate cleavage enzyme
MSNTSRPAILSCAVTGVLTNPKQHPVPVTPEQMADACLEAHEAGASIVHVHFRMQQEGLGHLPCWDPAVAKDICDAIREKVPGIIINMSTGVFGNDISGPVDCMAAVKPEYAACNSGSMNYLKLKKDNAWAWPPMLFDNPVEKVQKFLDAMAEHNTRPEFECFDSGHIRSVKMFHDNGMAQNPSYNFVMGVASGMPLDAEWLPMLLPLKSPESLWQVTAIGRQEIWDVHRRTAELGGNLRTGLEDTFYLPDGSRATSNGELIRALAECAKEAGRDIATLEQTREILGFSQTTTP